jgi:hypothetical protein
MVMCCTRQPCAHLAVYRIRKGRLPIVAHVELALARSTSSVIGCHDLTYSDSRGYEEARIFCVVGLTSRSLSQFRII